MEQPLEVITLMGHPIHAITESDCVRLILDELGAERGGWVVTPNLDHLRRLQRDARFRQTCAQASVWVPDGMPLIWASRLQGTPLPGRVAGSNLIFSLSEAAAAQGRSVFLLGGNPGTAEETAQIFKERYPRIEVAGVDCPPVGFERDPARMRGLREKLSAAKPDIVFVALGSPKQEFLIAELRSQLPLAWWLGVGISFSFVTGDVSRAPDWMQRAGLEWFFRMVQEPRRLARRYLVDGLPFAAQLMARAAVRGVHKRVSS